MTGKKIKVKKMGIFVSTLQHNSDKKSVTENKIQNNVRQYIIGKFSCDTTKHNFWICGVLQVFPHLIDAENMTVDEPDCILDSVEVNTVGEANDINGHPSQESDVTIDAENGNVDEPDIIHDSSKTNDANAVQTESMVDDDVEHNYVSQNIIQGLQKETVSDDVEMEKADETTDATGHVNKDCDDRIDEENTILDQGKVLSIQDGVEMNDATPMEGGSVIMGE